MKKLLAVAVIGLAGYKLVKKLRNKNEEVIENVEEEIVIDNDEEAIEVEDIENNVKDDLYRIFKHKLVDVYENTLELPINVMINILKILLVNIINIIFKATMFVGIICAAAARNIKDKLHHKYDIIM
jgi:hypothetical protein